MRINKLKCDQCAKETEYQLTPASANYLQVRVPNPDGSVVIRDFCTRTCAKLFAEASLAANPDPEPEAPEEPQE